MPEEVDHINGIRSDKRWVNLRDATRGENMCNFLQRSNNRSGYKGVCWHKHTGKWVAQISLNKKVQHLGLFDDPVKAHVVYVEAAKRLHGEFANDGYGPIL